MYWRSQAFIPLRQNPSCFLTTIQPWQPKHAGSEERGICVTSPHQPLQPNHPSTPTRSCIPQPSARFAPMQASHYAHLESPNGIFLDTSLMSALPSRDSTNTDDTNAIRTRAGRTHFLSREAP
ncbi:hypothetical protein O181_001493 [Austropuccinia psidii MF-1]|uniref:Uncharacterized protein n=1 Tax=Austropuccinia psidii MF-1 TaxID=1389203 RepID=A0A9Q3BAM2_9BASI|nr:hypothetical protein [Austropuccinia psidii MF-1]